MRGAFLKVKHLAIHRFRGVRELIWTVPVGPTCLVGHCDAGKSTILAAIEYALLPHSALRLTDADFYDCDAEQGFAIEVAISGVPGELLTDERFGRHIRGMTPSGEMHDEPGDNDEEVLTVRLTADSTLEPQWVIKNDRNGEGRLIGHYYRAKIGMARLGQEVDRDLS